MGLANDMKRLTEDIVSSYDMRVKGVGTLVNNVHRTLKYFTADRKKMASEQAKSLANFANGLTKSVDDLLKGFQKKHKEMSEGQAKALKDFTTNLSKNVGDMIMSFQKDHKAMAKSLKERLKKSKADIELYADNKLKEFSDGRADMSAELKSDLANYVAGIVSETKKVLSSFGEERKNLKDDIGKMATNWQALTTTMAKKKGIKPKVEAEVKVTTVKEAIEERVAKKEEEKKPLDLESKLIELIYQHPKGITLKEAGDSLGIAMISLGRLSKKLVDSNKIRKVDNRYFPVYKK